MKPPTLLPDPMTTNKKIFKLQSIQILQKTPLLHSKKTIKQSKSTILITKIQQQAAKCIE